MDIATRPHIREIVSYSAKVIADTVQDYFKPLTSIWVRLATIWRASTTVERLERINSELVRTNKELIEQVVAIDHRTSNAVNKLSRKVSLLESAGMAARGPDIIPVAELQRSFSNPANTRSVISHYLGVADALRLRGRVPQATRVLELLEGIEERHKIGDDSYLHVNLGEVFLEQGDRKLARMYFERATELSGSDKIVATALSRLASLEIEQGNLENAIGLAEQAATRYARISEWVLVDRLYLDLAIVLASRGDSERATEIVAKARRAAGRSEQLLFPTKTQR